jgi:hypothetical protein
MIPSTHDSFTPKGNQPRYKLVFIAFGVAAIEHPSVARPKVCVPKAIDLADSPNSTKSPLLGDGSMIILWSKSVIYHAKIILKQKSKSTLFLSD